MTGTVLDRPTHAFVPVLILAGNRDETVPRADTDRLDRHLRAAGADVTRHDLPAGYRPVDADTPLIRAWLAAFPPRRLP